MLIRNLLISVIVSIVLTIILNIIIWSAFGFPHLYIK